MSDKIIRAVAKDGMVRIIAGTLVDVGLGKIEAEEIPEIIESKERARAGKTLAAHGLYLVEVKYI